MRNNSSLSLILNSWVSGDHPSFCLNDSSLYFLKRSECEKVLANESFDDKEEFYSKVESLNIQIFENDENSSEDEDNDDFKYSRENLYHIIERGQDALDGILKVAQETDHPRAYEVAGQLLKTNADNAEKLVNLQTTKKKVREESGPKNVTNALFVGSTAELQKLIKGK